jgi:hypothetical protein
MLYNSIFLLKYIYIKYIRKNEILLFTGKWIELILSEVTQVQKAKSHMFSLKYGTEAQCKQYYIHTYRYMQNMNTKVGLVEETR